jgi:hypothetical protein
MSHVHNRVCCTDIPSTIHNNSTTSHSLLLTLERCRANVSQQAITTRALQYTINNQNDINATLLSQLNTIRDQRYIPYQPYIPPVMPSSVIQLQMATANVGVPMSANTIMKCKGVQSFTK